VKWSEAKRSGVELSENWWFIKFFVVVFVVFVVAVCIVYVLAVVVSFIIVFLYCVCALFVCNMCYLSVVLYYCHRVKAQLQFNKYMCVCVIVSVGSCLVGYIAVDSMPTFRESHTVQSQTWVIYN
jgi:hypothetical protein